ncbi:MAG: ABC transporter substrate-binding protein [Beijerinckiaceae bacterium]|jgi:NitT/TauT family transport system substrate-binding protein|nr:ABC transporter substrate-binding protein [Beijerinckiaceae bacterium]
MRVFSLPVAAAALLAGLASGAAQAQTQVRVGFIPVLGTAPIFVVDKEGWAKEAGLDFKFTTFESGPVMIQALASGTLDVYVAGVAPLGVARSKGIDVTVVAATAIEEMTVAAGAKLAPSFKEGVSPAEAFKAFRAANGKPARIATQPPGSVPHTTLNHWLFEVTKTDKADVEIVPMGIDATQQALLTGAVDGATIREPTDTIVQQRDKRIKIVALGGQMFPNQPGTVVAVSGAFLKKNPDGVQKIVSGVVRAVDLIKADPKRVAPAIEGALGKGLLDTATIVAALGSPASKFEANPMTIVEATKKMQAYQVSIGTLDKDVPLDGLFDASFFEKAGK